MQLNVLGLGTAAMDIVINCDDLPREDGFSFIQQEHLTPGGSCANIMVVLSALGHAPGLIAKLGNDHFASAFKDDLQKSGVSTDYILNKPQGTTLHTYITVTADGSKSIFANLGDSLLSLTPEEVKSDWLETIKVFYTDMFPAQPALKLARECQNREIPVVFNLQTSVPFMKMCGISRAEIIEMISLSSLFITSREGLQEFNAEQNPVQACKQIYKTHKNSCGVIATLGEKGSVWAYQDSVVNEPIFPVESKDTTGAGDAFAGAIIHSFFLDNQSHSDALKFSNACAAFKCTQPGPRFKGDLNSMMEFIKA